MLVNNSILKRVYRKREDWCHKGNFGNLLIIGGSKIYSGSPGFNALAAYRSGVDLATVVSVQRAADIVAGFSPDIITYPVEGDFFRNRHLKEVFNLAKDKDAVVIGGGIGRKIKTMLFVRKFLRKVNLPCVIDADAIYALKKKIVFGKDFVITPHAKEFFKLSDIKLSMNIKERVKQVSKVAKEFKTTILLKGHIDVIADSKKYALNKTGCSFMTKGGTGDTLAGIVGSLIAQGNNLFDAACAGAYINGKAGELVAKEKKQGLMASDLLDKIPEVIK